MRLFKPNIEKMKKKENVKGLIKVITDRNKEFEIAAKKIPLIKVYNKGKDNEVIEAQKALIQIGKPSVEPLIGALKMMPTYDLIVTLVELRDARAIEPLLEIMDSEDSFSGAEDIKKHLDKLKDVWIAEPFIKFLNKTDTKKYQYAREYAALALGEIKDKRAVDPLIEAIKDNNSRVRGAVVKAIGELKDTRAVEPLIAVLNDSDSYVRLAACVALGKLGVSRVVEILVQALSSKDHNTSVNASSSLSELAREAEPLVTALKSNFEEFRKVQELLVNVIKDKSYSHYERSAPARLLERVGIPDDPLTKAWYAVAVEDWKLAISLGKVSIDPLVYSLSISYPEQCVGTSAVGSEDRLLIYEAFVEWKDERGCSLLIKAFMHYVNEEDRSLMEYREALGLIVEKIGKPAVEPIITHLMKNPLPRHVRECVAKTMFRIGIPDDPTTQTWYAVAAMYWKHAISLGNAAIKPLIQALDLYSNRHEIDRYLEESIVKTLGDLKADEPLKDILKGTYSDDIKKNAATELAKMGYEK